MIPEGCLLQIDTTQGALELYGQKALQFVASAAGDNSVMASFIA
jgi:hypothetical protein